MTPSAHRPSERLRPRVVKHETRTYVLFVERSFPVEALMQQVAPSVGVRTWRVRSDDRGFLCPGEVEIEVTGSAARLAALERRWEHTLELLGETSSSF